MAQPSNVETNRSAFRHVPRIRPYVRPYRWLLLLAALQARIATPVTVTSTRAAVKPR